MTGLKGSFTLRPPDIYLEAAARWPITFHVEPTEPGHFHVELAHLERAGEPLTQAHMVCCACGQSVCCLSPDTDGPGYRVTAGQVQSGVLAHLKVAHEDALPLT